MWNKNRLAKVELNQIYDWKPETVGVVIFNAPFVKWLHFGK